MLIFLKKVSKDLRKYVESRNFEYTVMVEQGAAEGPNDHEANFESYDELLSSVRSLNPEAVITDYEHYIRLAARLSEDLGLPSISVDAAARCTDKNRMRKAFHAYDPSTTPDFMRILSEDDLERFAAEHDFPIMLKPTNMVKSLFITRNDDIKQLRANYRKVLAELPSVARELGADPDQEIIVEEFMRGSMHTVAGFADSEGNVHLIPDIVDIETGRDRGSDENYLYSRLLPSILDEDDQNSILAVAETGMKALGMTNSAAHIEVMLTSNGPKLIEIGARPGGYRPRMYTEARGIDFHGAFIAAATGETINLTSSAADATCTIEIFPEHQGTITEISHSNELEQLESMFYLSYRIKPGSEAGLPSQGFKSAVIITLVNSSQEQLLADKKYIDDNVKVIVN